MFSKRALLFAGTAASVGALVYALESSIPTPVFLELHASELVLHPPKLPWTHSGFFDSLDVASVRRGYKVYKEVCAQCHSVKYIHYYHLVDTIMTKEEAKKEAADAQIRDRDDAGEPTTRPGILTDALPSPYENRNQAEAANGGAYPPDLSLMVLARHDHEDYMYALLTSYSESPPPAGVDVGDKYYNPYFEGGVIAMPQALSDYQVEYADGTPATLSQMAKDVSTFLRWTSEPFHDDRKRYGIKVLALAPFVCFLLLYWKRRAWSFLETQKIFYRTAKGREPPAAASATKPADASK